ncbi:MAG TPA: hypothetical protein VJO33_20115 [Gemmatimonadaceae bacterium]|nr:hypothetical protein [Gemmatimonadaceae bacterium]
MGKLTDALKAGVRAAREEHAAQRSRPDGDRYIMARKLVCCGHCGGDRFEKRDVVLRPNTMFSVDASWLDRGAVVLICVHCTSLQWFGTSPEAAD